MKIRLLSVAALAGASVLVATSTGAARTAGGGPVKVVAAENVWGSIAAQVGGSRAQVTSIVTNPATDPHDYEPTAIDARTLASAQLVIVNGAGYDPWVTRLLKANPVKGRIVIDVGELVGVGRGGNPHLWYSPTDVSRVIAAIVRAYRTIDPADAAAVESTTRFFRKVILSRYNRSFATIRRRFAHTKIGASESVVAPLAASLHLALITPSSFLRAVSQGAEPTVRDLSTINHQIASGEIKVWVYNSQNATPDVRRLTRAARKRHIPVVTVTETLSPATVTFEQWQVGQLDALTQALVAATHK